MTHRLLRRIEYRAEALAARAALALLRLLGPVRASNLGGAVARAIGPLLPVSRVADINLRYTMPELDEAARQRVIRGVWDNLGRTVAELPHAPSLRTTTEGPGWVLEGADIQRACRETDGPLIIFSAHIGSWEIMPRAMYEGGVPTAVFYRAASNPEVDALIAGLREGVGGTGTPLFTKSVKGARAAMQYLSRGGRVGMLVDQKMDEGIEARLFGRPARTTAAAAAFALRFRCPLVPMHSVRIGPARYRMVLEPPLPLPDTGDQHADIATLTQAMNDCMERWIREWPEGWLWLHRRFPKEIYRRGGTGFPVHGAG